MLRFFITGIGGDVAQGIARIIRENFENVNIVGSDIGSNHAGCLFVDSFEIIPTAASVSYIDTINSLVSENQIDILIPTSEPEIEVISGILESALGCKVIVPGHKVVEVCLDKFETNKFLTSIGLCVPWTVKSSEFLPLKYPCIFKAMKGSGSKLLNIVEDELEAKYLKRKYNDTIFQELLLPDKNEITCPVYRSSSGQTSVLQLQRRLVGGATSWAKVVFYPDINRICHLVAKELDLVGSMNIQLRLTEDGPRIFEINPRFSSTVYMRNLVGFADVIWSIKDALGMDFAFPDIPLDIELVRVFDSKIINH